MKTAIILAIVAVVAALGAAGLVTAASFSAQAHSISTTETNCHPIYHPNNEPYHPNNERGENLRDC